MTNGERRDDLIQAPDPDAEANEIALGQLYGTFERGLEALDLSSRWAAEAGFVNDPGVNDDEALTTAWLEVEGIR